MQTLITGIGRIVSGDIDAPLIDGDSISVVDGRIDAVGYGVGDRGDADTVIDAKGTTVIPGLIDSHAHPVVGDFTPRQRTVDFIESSLHGGVTTMISAGEPHVPGRPKDIVGLKALAIAIARTYATFRPGGGASNPTSDAANDIWTMAACPRDGGTFVKSDISFFERFVRMTLKPQVLLVPVG